MDDEKDIVVLFWVELGGSRKGEGKRKRRTREDLVVVDGPPS